MMKQDRNFRLPKEIKRLLASMSKDESINYKSIMIQSIILGSVEPPREKKKNKHKTITTESVVE